MELLEPIWSFEVSGISIKLYFYSFSIILGTYVARRYIIKKWLSRAKELAKKTAIEWDDAILETLTPPLSLAILVLGFWTAISILPLPREPVNIANFVYLSGKMSLLLIVTWVFVRSINTFEKVLRHKASDPEHWMDSSLVPLITLSSKTLVAIIVFVTISQNLGYSVSGLVASLGITGIAVALAAKDTLANFFGSLVVMLDKPFRIGDWIKSDTFEGVVEEIGFRSTRIRTFERTVQIVPNDKIANMMVENMDRRKDEGLNVRRVKMTIGLEYKTSAGQMEEAVKAIRGILKSSQNVDQKFFLVNFTDFGDSSLNIFVYYYTATADWARYLDIRQEINLVIMKKLEELGLAIAFPTQTIHIEKPK